MRASKEVSVRDSREPISWTRTLHDGKWWLWGLPPDLSWTGWMVGGLDLPHQIRPRL